MNFAKIVLAVVAAHLVFLAGFLLRNRLAADAEPSDKATAGVSWSSQDPDADEPTFDPAGALPFGPEPSDATGYNAGDRQAVVAQSAAPGTSSSRRVRQPPRRPDEANRPDAGTRSPAQGGVRPDYQRLSALPSNPSERRPSSPSSQTVEYKVANGDSLWGIAQRFGTSVRSIVEANPGIKANQIRVGQTLRVPREEGSPDASGNPDSGPESRRSSPPSGATYTVKAGDSLSGIAARQGVTVAALKRANGLSGDLIRVGQELTIPGGASRGSGSANQPSGLAIAVKPGDSLSKIAARYDIDVRELIVHNEIEDPRQLRVGQTIVIPRRGREPGGEGPRSSSAPERRAPRLPEEPPSPVSDIPSELPEEPPVQGTLPLLEDDEAGMEDDALIERPVVPIEE